MRPCCRIQEWKRAESLSCTPKHSLTVALQSRPSAGWRGSRQTPVWAHEYVGAHLYCTSPSPSVRVGEWCSNLCEECAVSVCFCVCVLYPLPRETGLLPGPDSVIGSSENPNEAMSISAAAWLPLRSPRSPRAPTPSPLASLRTRCKERRDGICWRFAQIRVNFKPISAAVKVTAAKSDPITSDGGSKLLRRSDAEFSERCCFWISKKINKPELDLMYSAIKIKKLKIPGWHFHQDCQEKKKNCFGTFINWKQKRSALLVKVTPLLIPHSQCCAEICMRSFRLQRASHSK